MKRKIRSFAAKVLKSSFFLEWVYNHYYRLRNKKVFIAEVERRKRLSIFEYEALAKDIPFCPLENIKDSNYYGHAYSIKKYSGCNFISSGIEHGIYLGNRVSDAEKLRTTRSIIAMSQNRIDSFKEHAINKPVLAIGPYIHYAQPLMEDEAYCKLKKELGKVLLVFPFHSGIFKTMSFDMDLLISKIEEYRIGFDTVLVCLHHLDVTKNNQYTSVYKEKGYRIVCAGHKYDLNFLSRLKSIIGLSDFVLSNSIGTQIGYCAYMNKPQIIIYDENSLTALNYLNLYSNDSAKLAYDQTMEIIQAFKESDDRITTDIQKQVLEKYWGHSFVKSPDEMKRAIEILNER